MITDLGVLCKSEIFQTYLATHPIPYPLYYKCTTSYYYHNNCHTYHSILTIDYTLYLKYLYYWHTTLCYWHTYLSMVTIDKYYDVTSLQNIRYQSTNAHG